MNVRALRAALAVLAASLVLSAAPTTAVGPILATVTGPVGLAPGGGENYSLSISGGPDGLVNYSVRWYITAPDPTGGLPQQSSPSSLSGTGTTFGLNVTAPTTEQTVTLVVHVSASSGGTTEETTVERSIVIITPIVLSATFRNTASTAALNVTVRFYVDDAPVGTKTIPRVASDGQATATLAYLPVGLPPGTHRVRVEADLDGNGAIDPARGESVLTELFYKGTPGLSTGWTLLIGIGAFVPVLVITIALRRRQRT